ncbi:MAG: antirestriction protein ArdA [Mobilitalea sp.]
MYITIKNPGITDNRMVDVWFPCEEEKLSKVCSDVGIRISKGMNCFITGSDDKDFNSVIKDNYCNVDELNFLAKRLDSFDTREKLTFYASAIAIGADSMEDLINLTYNTHCYSIINDFSNLNEVGKYVYLNEAGGASIKELEELDGKAIVENLMKFSPMKAVTSYGVVYQNRIEPEMVYDGKHFPCYYWQTEIATLELGVMGEREFLYLPCPNSTIEKALMRLEVEHLSECRVALESNCFPERMLEMIAKENPITSKMDVLNDFALRFKEMGSRDGDYFEKLMEYVGPRNLEELKILLDCMYEFEMFDGIRNAEQYGRYMICDSGHFEYDSNLEGYIDFKGYGQQKIKNECGAFTKKGYITYYGYNQDLQNLLFENLGMVVENQKQPLLLKLYMPLKAITYDVENDYGDMEKSEQEEELSSDELLAYEDEILDAIAKSKMPEEDKRGLMEYYDTCDSVNAKVARYDFTVEEVKGELMGVVVLTLNDTLMNNELEIMKAEVYGQASDGWAEGFEQREIQADDKGIYVSFWNSSDWFLKTAEEMGLTEQSQTMGGISI